jgi:predicted anti-sigma-YlaC factor YlaD
MPRTPECDQIEELLSALQDGAVTAAEQSRVERHLADCADCRASAAAFQRVDERLRRYLQLTPVPPIDAPWRQERSHFARWLALFGSGRARITLAGVTTVVILIVAARLLAGGPGGKTTEVATDSGAVPQIMSATAAAGAAVPASGGAGAAKAQPTAPAGLAANAPVSQAASGASSAATQPPQPRAAAGAARVASPAASAAAPAGAAPAASPAFAATTINLAQRYHLASAVSLTLHTATTAGAPLPADQQAAVVQALNEPVAPRAATSPASSTTELHFAFADGQQVVLTYEPLTDTVRLPDGSTFAAPPTLAAVLMTIEAPH